jgi:hypothetical protein
MKEREGGRADGDVALRRERAKGARRPVESVEEVPGPDELERRRHAELSEGIERVAAVMAVVDIVIGPDLGPGRQSDEHVVDGRKGVVASAEKLSRRGQMLEQVEEEECSDSAALF